MNKLQITQILKKDGVGVLPTDTLYGVVGRALSKKTVERIYKIKGRDESKPFIILISSLRDLEKFSIKKEHYDILHNVIMKKKVWPGKVSVILPCTNKKFEYLHRGKKSLAFRFPKNKLLISILKKTGPLVAPSANSQGEKPAATISEAKKYFGADVDFYLAGGRKEGKPSKIISIGGDGAITILR